jgi:hypothetical protein
LREEVPLKQVLLVVWRLKYSSWVSGKLTFIIRECINALMMIRYTEHSVVIVNGGKGAGKKAWERICCSPPWELEVWHAAAIQSISFYLNISLLQQFLYL